MKGRLYKFTNRNVLSSMNLEWKNLESKLAPPNVN